jgi:YVTN family beta-propeller protein
VVATADRVFVSNAHNDSITVIDAKTNSVAGQIDIRIPGLEKLRGVLPIGMAYHEGDRLAAGGRGGHQCGGRDRYAASASQSPRASAGGLVSQPRADRSRHGVRNQCERAGHRPERLAIRVSSGEPGEAFMGTFRRGSIASFPLPDAAEVAAGTRTVMDNNGLTRATSRPGAAAQRREVRGDDREREPHLTTKSSAISSVWRTARR